MIYEHIMIYENLTDELSMKLLESKLSIKTTEHFCKSGGLFNCEEKGKTLLSVVFSNLGDRENFLQVDIKLEQLPQKQKFHHERDDVTRNHLSLQICSSLL